MLPLLSYSDLTWFMRWSLGFTPCILQLSLQALSFGIKAVEVVSAAVLWTMGAKGQANPGLPQIQDILHHTLKKWTTFRSECLLPSRGELEQISNLWHYSIKSSDWGVLFLCFAKKSNIPVIIPPAMSLKSLQSLKHIAYSFSHF